MTYLQRPPRKRQNPKEDQRTLLVARYKRLGGRIHKRMCNLPTIKNPHAQKAHTTILHPHQRRHTSFSGHSNGLNHGITSTKRTGCHTNDCGSQMLQSSSIPAMLHAHLRSRNCPAVPQPHLPMVWTP